MEKDIFIKLVMNKLQKSSISVLKIRLNFPYKTVYRDGIDIFDILSILIFIY